MKKTSTIQALSSLTLALALTASVQAEPPKGKGGDRGGMMNRGSMMAGIMVLKKLDTDGDGELSRAEIDASSSVLRGLDSNGDGKVSQDELGGGGDMGLGGQGQGPAKPMSLLKDNDGDGKITAEDLPEKMREHFSKLDVNGDGELDNNEKALAESKLKERMDRGQGGKRGNENGGEPVKPKRPE